MKNVFLLLALTGLFAVPAFAEKIDLGGGKTLHLVLPDTWTSAPNSDSADQPAIGRSARYVTKNGSNEAVLIAIIPVPDDRFGDPANLRALVEETSAQLVSGSVEGKANIKELRFGGITGYGATFTDANLVGKPSVKEDYKTVTSCFVYLGDRVMVAATVFSDDVQGKSYTEGMRIVKSLSLDLPQNTI